MLINYFLTGLSSFLLGIALISLLKKVFLKSNVLVQLGIPLIGGLSIWLSFVLAYGSVLFLLRASLLSRAAAGIILASAIMLVFGILDDWHELSILAKFSVQVIATSFLIFFGIRTHIVNISNLINIIITLVWVIGITNAFNHLDITDGLAAGTAVIVGISFFIVSALNHDTNTAVLTLALSGAVLSFFIYNFPPARVYMGNSGSHFLGFVLAAIALVISYAPLERKVALFSPLLILGLPIFDTAFLILMRTIKKSLPFKKSNDHLALRFLALGYSKKKVLLAMLILSLFFALCGISVSQGSNLFGAALIVIVVLVSLALTSKMSKVSTYA